MVVNFVSHGYDGTSPTDVSYNKCVSYVTLLSLCFVTCVTLLAQVRYCVSMSQIPVADPVRILSRGTSTYLRISSCGIL